MEHGASGDRPRKLLSTARLVSLDSADLVTVVTHPEQQRVFLRIAELISELRACAQPEDHCHFQEALLHEMRAGEHERGLRARVVKRLIRGETLPSDHPSILGDVTSVRTWEVEEYLYVRLARQLRVVVDGLAWTCFNYGRREMIALSRNNSPGAMDGKVGLDAEWKTVRELWENRGRFGLLHDLTNCLRIADITEFEDGRRVEFHEVKTTPHTNKKQRDRSRAVLDAIDNGGRLPGSTDARLVDVDVAYRTNLTSLDDVFQLAKRDGCRGIKLPGGRAVAAVSVSHALVRWGGNSDAILAAWGRERAGAIKRAGIQRSSHHLNANSGDTAARSPLMAPFSIYPLSPLDCAALICDRLIFESIISVESLVEALQRVGLTASVILPDGDGELAPRQGVIQVHWRKRGMILHNQGLNVFLYELLEPDTWAQGVKELITSAGEVAEPWLVFKNEAASWAR